MKLIQGTKMKNLFIILAFVLGSGFASYSQFYYGASGGINAFKLKGSDVYGGMNYLNGISGGLTLGMKIVTDFSIHSGIYYNETGVSQKFTIREKIQTSERDTPVLLTVNRVFSNKLKISYVQVPILFKKSFSLKGGVYPYQRVPGLSDIDLYLGPYVAYRFATKANMSASRQETKLKNGVTVNNPEVSDTLSFRIGQNRTAVSADTAGFPSALFLPYIPTANPDISTGLKSLDIGIIAGIGASVEISAYSKLTFEARFIQGLVTIDKDYFNDVTYVYSLDNNYKNLPAEYVNKVTDKNYAKEETIGANTFYRFDAKNPKDLRNSGFAYYIGIIHYLGKENY
jgi:hypothetical protein